MITVIMEFFTCLISTIREDNACLQLECSKSSSVDSRVWLPFMFHFQNVGFPDRWIDTQMDTKWKVLYKLLC